MTGTTQWTWAAKNVVRGVLVAAGICVGGVAVPALARPIMAVAIFEIETPENCPVKTVPNGIWQTKRCHVDLDKGVLFLTIDQTTIASRESPSPEPVPDAVLRPMLEESFEKFAADTAEGSRRSGYRASFVPAKSLPAGTRACIAYEWVLVHRNDNVIERGLVCIKVNARKTEIVIGIGAVADYFDPSKGGAADASFDSHARKYLATFRARRR
jgi:hypothetical protein